MIQIKNPRIPTSVIAFNLDPSKKNDWKAFREDNAYKIAKKTLIRNQNNLCAYCMCKLQDFDKVAIEHILPKEHFKNEITNFKNMLAVCKNDLNHCDNSKGSSLLKVVDKKIRNKIEDLIDYDARGKIFSRYPNQDLDDDLDKENLLNLNLDFLMSRRLTILEQFEETYVKIANKKRIKLRISTINTHIENLYSSDTPYKGILINKLKKDFL